MFSSHTISTSDIHVKSSEMSEEMETYVKELARSVAFLSTYNPCRPFASIQLRRILRNTSSANWTERVVFGM